MIYRLLASLTAAVVLTACASTISSDSLSKPADPARKVVVKEFRYLNAGDGAASYGLNSGTYKIEFESSEGYYFRGVGNCVKIAALLNQNKVAYPDNMFPGGLFVSKSKSDKPYQVYYYQYNLSPTPNSIDAAPVVYSTATPVGTQVGGAVIGGALVDAIISSAKGKILLLPTRTGFDLRPYVSEVEPETK